VTCANRERISNIISLPISSLHICTLLPINTPHRPVVRHFLSNKKSWLFGGDHSVAQAARTVDVATLGPLVVGRRVEAVTTVDVILVVVAR
jgi:hypothetical protein